MTPRTVWFALLLAATLPAALPAQAEAPRDTAGAELLRQEIERRFTERVQTNLGLSDHQMTKLKATHAKYGPRRRQLMREYVGYELALNREMRPGMPANADSVRVYLDGQQRVRAAQLALDQDADREMAGYLTPVQRAQYHRMWRNFLQRVNELRQGRQNRLGGERPMRPPRRRP